MPGPMDALLQQFIGQTQQMNQQPAPSQEGSPWQQELLESVNPEKAKRQNIARALATASQALATTPGNFLQGIAAGTSAGANSYLTGKEDMVAKRAQIMQSIEQAQRQAQDQRLARLQDALGISRGIQNDDYARGRDKLADGRYTDEKKYQREQDATERADRLAGKNKESLAYKNELKRSQRAAVSEYQKWEKEAGDDITGAPLTDADKQAKWNEIVDRMGIQELYEEPADNSSAAVPVPSPKVEKPDTKIPPNDALAQAKEAIARGADPAAVRQRLIDNGYDASGL